MPSAVSVDFERFITQLGVRQDVAAALWEADIHTPQELGSLEVAELKKITSNPLLVNHFHPILQKHVFNITMAKDPFKKAMAVIKKYAPKDEDDDEPMETNTAADSTVSDARGFVSASKANPGTTRPEPQPGNRGTARPVQQQGNTGGRSQAQNRAARDNSTSFNNRGTTMNTDGGGMVHTHFTVQGPGGFANPLAKGITITGGNFVQTNLGGQGPVTYNNTNTVITTTDNSEGKDPKIRRSQILNDYLFLDGNRMRIADMHWNDGSDYWVDNIRMESTRMETYMSHMASSDVYEIRSHGNSRALILNNSHFNHNTGLGERTGADVDCTRMKTTLEQLGFVVEVAENKRASEMKSHLEEFAKSTANIKADMIAVYIGSHGERDVAGNDTFLGSDGARVNFSEVKKLFDPKMAPLLKKKPKLFFLQFCRQGNGRTPVPVAAPLSDSVSSDAIGTLSDEETTEPMVADVPLPSEEKHAMDMICVYATLAGSKAYRDTADGSWFVTALIRVLQKNAHSDDLLSMLTKVNNSVSFNQGKENSELAVQISEVVHNLRKKIFFYPGLGA